MSAGSPFEDRTGSHEVHLIDHLRADVSHVTPVDSPSIEVIACDSLGCFALGEGGERPKACLIPLYGRRGFLIGMVGLPLFP